MPALAGSILKHVLVQINFSLVPRCPEPAAVAGVFTWSSRVIPSMPETVEGVLGAQAAPVCSPVAMATCSLATDELLLSIKKH